MLLGASPFSVRGRDDSRFGRSIVALFHLVGHKALELSWELYGNGRHDCDYMASRYQVPDTRTQ